MPNKIVFILFFQPQASGICTSVNPFLRQAKQLYSQLQASGIFTSVSPFNTLQTHSNNKKKSTQNGFEKTKHTHPRRP